VTTPAGQDPVKDEDGTITLPGGGTITVGGPGGATIIAPPGTTVTADGQIKAPAGSGGLKVSYGGFTFSVPESLTIILDEEAPLGFYISSSNPFLDVSESDWFYDAVMYAFNLGLMNGTASDMFSPNNPTTRAMIVTILYRLEGSPEVEGSSEFTDVPNGQWYTDAVIWGAKNDIVLGFPEGDFRPNSNITREQFATILHRYADYKEYDTSSGADADLSGYTDEDQIHDYAVDHMKWANAEGLITGRTATTLVPLGNATRAEAATIMMRFIEGLMK
ncbi:MAG: S-layer homology domain-containing protein, partial [Oscillospiraceae bacterium]|nr:S-layer homology domain-containing protein [Oscillospiraceae bacterium]